ncbi:hypothetical protein A0H81_12241 [Grifola frondosa]|uniref:Uncharacterized protein n=1 Tax=Grifola frondosa TaxID=5627 RepID=A0A1C7LSE8_GRIFR|nr:hypothetical protein A0H81_12241 [Grifola frondosa]
MNWVLTLYEYTIATQCVWGVPAPRCACALPRSTSKKLPGIKAPTTGTAAPTDTDHTRTPRGPEPGPPCIRVPDNLAGGVRAVACGPSRPPARSNHHLLIAEHGRRGYGRWRHAGHDPTRVLILPRTARGSLWPRESALEFRVRGQGRRRASAGVTLAATRTYWTPDRAREVLGGKDDLIVEWLRTREERRGAPHDAEINRAASLRVVAWRGNGAVE